MAAGQLFSLAGTQLLPANMSLLSAECNSVRVTKVGGAGAPELDSDPWEGMNRTEKIGGGHALNNKHGSSGAVARVSVQEVKQNAQRPVVSVDSFSA